MTCPLCCCTPCDPAIDAAVRRVRTWFRKQVLKSLAESKTPIKPPAEPEPPAWPVANGGGRDARQEITVAKVMELVQRGFTVQAIATALGCSDWTVKNRMQKAKEKGVGA